MPGQTDVVTYHYDNARTGANLSETVLTPANVNATKFGKMGFHSVDGKVDGQPVYLSQVSISGQGTHNVLYVVSEHASVYAFDADSGTTLWHASLLGSGETPAIHATVPRSRQRSVSPLLPSSTALALPTVPSTP